jgi:hypothetical protein
MPESGIEYLEVVSRMRLVTPESVVFQKISF